MEIGENLSETIVGLAVLAFFGWMLWLMWRD